MALLWMDGFDHYGTGSTGRGNMLNGVYAELGAVPVNGNPSTAFPRTGTHSFTGDFGTDKSALRRVILKGAISTIGMGGAFYFTNLPVNNDNAVLMDLRSVANVVLFRLILQSTGVLKVQQVGGGAWSYETPLPIVVTEAFQHIEMKTTLDAVNGAVEVRWNGVTVINQSGLNLGSVACGQVNVLSRIISGLSPSLTAYLDDYFAWDDSGTMNNDFLGDRRVRTLYPNANTAVADWTVTGAASGYEAIDETAPDFETTYISATPPTGDPLVPVVSEFELQDPPVDIGAIAAVQTYIMQRKTEAGDCNTQSSLISGVDVSAGTDRPITEEYTYWMDVFELDPATGTPWTEASLTAAKLRIARTL